MLYYFVQKKISLFAILILPLVGYAQSGKKDVKLDKRPNIVWIIADEISNNFDFSYQGNKIVNTPNIDILANEGVVFSNAYAVNPICSPSRSGVITGMYPTTIDAQNHRSSRGIFKIYLSKEIKPIPEFFRAAGYYVCNVNESFTSQGKTDYNFVFNVDSLYDRPNWENKKPGQPFFAQVQLEGGKYQYEPYWWNKLEKELPHLVTGKQVNSLIPPYYPNDSFFRNSWANYLNAVQYTDLQVGHIIKKLKEDGVLDNTIIFFSTDHGEAFARSKQFLYDEGTKIPFIVWAPNRLRHLVRKDLISNIDMAATSMYFAGISIPKYIQSRPLFGPDFTPRKFVVCARDRADETVDKIRSLRMGDFKYIRNYFPKRPYLQPNVYKYKNVPSVAYIVKLSLEDKLDKAQSLITAKVRPIEELYNLKKDPFEIHNLANNPKYSQKLKKLRSALVNWRLTTDDQGMYGESEKSYNSSMKAYLNEVKEEEDYYNELKKNIDTMKLWRAEGK